MTNKPNLVVLILLLVAFSFTANAQSGNQTSLSVGADLDVPLHNRYNGPGLSPQVGLGVNLKLEQPITNTLHFTVGTGVVFMQSDRHYMDYPVNLASASYVAGVDFSKDAHDLYVNLPVTAGLKYYWAKYFYVSAEAGSAFKISYRARTSFIYSGGAGAVVPFGLHNGLDFGLRFERGYKNIDYTKPINQLGLNVAYKYRF